MSPLLRMCVTEKEIAAVVGFGVGGGMTGIAPKRLIRKQA